VIQVLDDKNVHRRGQFDPVPIGQCRPAVVARVDVMGRAKFDDVTGSADFLARSQWSNDISHALVCFEYD
jgi:hypothetical protein